MSEPKASSRSVGASTTSPRRPLHVGTILGLSTGLYALTLAGVTAAQVDSDRALIAEREPVQRAIDMLADHHDEMADRLSTTRARYRVASEAYAGLSTRLGAIEGGLDELSDMVGKIEGSALRLPDRLDLPSVPRITSTQPAPRTTQKAQPPAPKPPPTDGKSGASGGK